MGGKKHRNIDMLRQKLSTGVATCSHFGGYLLALRWLLARTSVATCSHFGGYLLALRGYYAAMRLPRGRTNSNASPSVMRHEATTPARWSSSIARRTLRLKSFSSVSEPVIA